MVTSGKRGTSCEAHDVVAVPQGVFIVPVRWVFAYKFDDQGLVTKFKAPVRER